MVKQRRPSTRPTRPGAPSGSDAGPHASVQSGALTNTNPQANHLDPAPHSPAVARPVSSNAFSQPQRRSTYFEAVAIYERGLEALQRHEYQQATDLLESVLRQYPEEKELHERVRLYLNICRRQAERRAAAPETVEERLYAATLAINGGQYDQAIAHLRLVRDEDPDNDHALYMLAVAHAQRDEHAEAVAHLERAIALNPENRGLARNDPDLEPLHDDDAFRAALEAPPSSSKGFDPKRRPVRTKTGR
jgi:tetratricopeptide (TPR) repeat protein